MGKLAIVIFCFRVDKLVGVVGKLVSVIIAPQGGKTDERLVGKLVSVIFVHQGWQIGGGSGQIGGRYYRSSRWANWWA